MDEPRTGAAIAAPEYDFALIANANFRAFKRGDLIEDPAIISQILDSHHEHFVVRVAKPTH